MSDIQSLINQIHQEAKRETFPLDIPVYKTVKKEPTKPILYYGNLKSNICFFGRDLGRDEVMAGQPLIGAAGTLVRQGFYYAIHQQKTNNKKELESIGDRLILTNTVPYKPPGNKAYSMQVKNRFRPFIEQLLVIYWQGNQIITLGTEAFKWFTPYSKRGEVNQFWDTDDRYQTKLVVNLTAADQGGRQYQKEVSLYPLPHPSPLNQQYYEKFPAMLQQRLTQVAF
jgi:uracil-DNA glycosylase family 4